MSNQTERTVAKKAVTNSTRERRSANGKTRPTSSKTKRPGRREPGPNAVIRPAPKNNDEGFHKDTWVRLEFLTLKIIASEGKKFTLNKNKGWDLYFALEIEHPTDQRRLVAVTFPSTPIDFSAADKNIHRFGHKEKGGREGAEIYVGPMPSDERITVQVEAIQAKNKTRRTGDSLESVTGFLDKNVASQLGPAAASNPYVAAGIIANKGANLVGQLLEKTKDKSRGRATLDEAFDDAKFHNRGRARRVVKFSGKDIELAYRWSVFTPNK